MNLKQNMAEH